MRTINIMPRIETTLIHTYPGSGPYGAKGDGEIACCSPMAANATGVRIKILPLSAENVLRALKEAGRYNQTKTNAPVVPLAFFWSSSAEGVMN